MAEVYERQGMSPERAAAAAADVMREPDVALSVHAREELGVDPDELPPAMRAAGLSLVCFLFGAVLPLIPWYIGGGSSAAWASLILGTIAAAIVGGIVARFADRPVWFGVLRQVGIVLVACAVTYGIGELVGVNVA